MCELASMVWHIVTGFLTSTSVSQHLNYNKFQSVNNKVFQLDLLSCLFLLFDWWSLETTVIMTINHNSKLQKRRYSVFQRIWLFKKMCPGFFFHLHLNRDWIFKMPLKIRTIGCIYRDLVFWKWMNGFQ